MQKCRPFRRSVAYLYGQDQMAREIARLEAAGFTRPRSTHRRVGEVQGHAAGGRFGDKAALELTVRM